jgi:hypothetical protein
MGDEEVVVHTRPGLVLLTPAGVSHFERAHTSYSHAYFLLDQKRLAGILKTSDLESVRTFFDDKNHRLEHAMVSLAHEWHGNDLHRERMVEYLFNQIMVLFERLEKKPEPNNAEHLVRKVEQLLEERLAAPPTVCARDGDRIRCLLLIFKVAVCAATWLLPKNIFAKCALKPRHRTHQKF